MESKLNLNTELVDKARASARRIAEGTQDFIDLHTTVTVERTVCRLLGIDGVNELEVPFPTLLSITLWTRVCSQAAPPITSAMLLLRPAWIPSR